ncbi:hypothetical protein Acr_17g0008470 [Actinidia rufa]|uniref:Uncharacterized protein n=1 Tax=Actinidia rufa TaxID=165716 RepID=A0A7J0G3B1_9ERIC|nr:hypothetical protein Acr_17g0008470 [Actinidia rufa]
MVQLLEIDTTNARRPLARSSHLRVPPVAAHHPEGHALGAPLLPPRVAAAAIWGEAGGGGAGRVQEALHAVPPPGAESTRAGKATRRWRRRPGGGEAGCGLGTWWSSLSRCFVLIIMRGWEVVEAALGGSVTRPHRRSCFLCKPVNV